MTLHAPRNVAPHAPLVGRAVCLAAAISWAGTALAAPPPMTLLDAELRARSILVLSLSDREAHIADEHGLAAVIGLDHIAALAPADWASGNGAAAAAPRGRPGMLTMTDGSRLVGRLDAAASASADAVAWNSSVFGAVSVPLERISEIVLIDAADADAAVGPAADVLREDEVWLTNGDRLTGFIESIGPSVTIDIGQAAADGEPVVLGAGAVARIRLASPPAPAQGVSVWLADGTAVSGVRIESSPGNEGVVRVTLAREFARDSDGTGARPSADVDLATVRGVVPDSARWRPLRLADITETSSSFGVSATLGDAGRAGLRAPDLVLPAPMTVTIAVPTGAEWFGTTIVLPPDAHEWGDCEVIAEVLAPGGVQASARTRVSAATPSRDLRLALSSASGPATLRITLDPGALGPVQDRVTLRHPVFLLPASGRPASAAPLR